MKRLAFVVAFALLTLTLPELAASGPIGPVPVPPYCHTIHGTLCTAQTGAQRSCTDLCGNSLYCICTPYAGKKYWWCQYEC